MKKILILAAIILTSAIALLATSSVIESFTATSDGESITVNWRSLDENNINKFVVERSADQSYFKAIHEENSKGAPSYYTFIDEEAFMKETSSPNKENNDRVLTGNNYKYRIKVISKDNSYQYTDAISIAHNTSSIRKTWGMIKEMFK